MTLKELWARTNNWLRAHKIYWFADNQPEIDEDGLISEQVNSVEPAEVSADSGQRTADTKLNDKHAAPKPDAESSVQYPVSRIETPESKNAAESLEKIREGFDKLVNQLQGINEHLNRQAEQHEALMGRIKQLPELLESIPAMVENQKKITEQLFEQLKSAAARNEQFMDAVEKIPSETARQTDALVNIDNQLAAAADIDVQMAENFNSFNQTLDKLNQSTISHTDGILQMSKTFAASDRYLKYIISKQSKRFMWIFIAAIGVCVAVILILTGIIIYLKAV